MIDFFFSNRIETLYQELKKELFFKEPQNAFTRRMIVVPSLSLKSWLMLEMAKDPDLKIAIGIEVHQLDQAIDKLKVKKKCLSHLELSLMIEVQIKKMISQSDVKHQELFEYLKQYSSLSRKSEKRLTALSSHLSHLFIQYGTYGGNWLASIDKENGFQIEIWKAIFGTDKYNTLKSVLDNHALDPVLKTENHLKIFLFSFSFLPKIYYDFFSRISHDLQVNYYLLSPCQAFWSDLQSNWQYGRLKTRLADEASLQLDQFLAEQNPLLANFGHIGKEMAKLIEETAASINSSYMVSKSVLDYPQYEKQVFDELSTVETKMNLLHAIQADLTLQRQPALDEKIALNPNDDSIQLHIASTAFREVQILYDNLLSILLRHKDSLSLNNMIVMAPDIMDYEPFIHAVFGSKESVLDYHVQDLNMPAKNALVQDFMHLLSLREKRFSADVFLELFYSHHFQKAQNLTADEVEKISHWLKITNFRWGHNKKDRQEYLVRDHFENIEIDQALHGTLNDCLDRLFAALVVDHADELEILPADGVSLSDAPLLGKLATLSRHLRNDLQMTTNGTEMSLADWASYLECMANAYFGIQDTDENLTEDAKFLLKPIQRLTNLKSKFPEETFSFHTIKSHLETLFKEEQMDFQASHLNSIRFCSMLPMRQIPADVIALIGLNEDSFPKKDDKNSLDLLKKNKNCDYMPSKTDYDRYLFLESLLSSRCFFCLSYVEKETKGSPLVTELVNYIEDGYTIGEKSFSEVNIKKHPFYPFDRRYFEKDSGFKSFSSFNYLLSQQFYNEEKVKKSHFFQDFKIKKEFPESIKEVTITLKELANFAKNPLKTYFNQALGIYLKGISEKIKTDEDFVISHLDFSKVKKQSLKMPVNMEASVEKMGLMPNGLFKEIAREKIQKEEASLSKRLELLGIQKHEIFKIDLGFDEPLKLESGNWQLPALKFNYQNKILVTITGSFEEVCSKGLIVHAEDDKIDSVKVFPLFLVFNCLMEQFRVADRQLIFIKSGTMKNAWFENASSYLENYLTYYFKGIKNASPLIPEWVHKFVYDEDLLPNLNKSFQDEYRPIYNEYLHWMRNKEELAFCESFHKEWKMEAKTLFLEMYEAWYTK